MEGLGGKSHKRLEKAVWWFFIHGQQCNEHKRGLHYDCILRFRGSCIEKFVVYRLLEDAIYISRRWHFLPPGGIEGSVYYHHQSEQTHFLSYYSYAVHACSGFYVGAGKVFIVFGENDYQFWQRLEDAWVYC